MQEDPRLRMLFDYTIFHIGVYITLGTAILASLQLKEKRERRDALWLIPLLLLIPAGAFGGWLGSSLPSFSAYDNEQPPAPANAAPAQIQPLKSLTRESADLLLLKMPYTDLAFWEHVFFWLAVASAVGVAIWDVCMPQKPNRDTGQTTRIRVLDEITIKTL